MRFIPFSEVVELSCKATTLGQESKEPRVNLDARPRAKPERGGIARFFGMSKPAGLSLRLTPGGEAVAMAATGGFGGKPRSM